MVQATFARRTIVSNVKVLATKLLLNVTGIMTMTIVHRLLSPLEKITSVPILRIPQRARRLASSTTGSVCGT